MRLTRWGRLLNAVIALAMVYAAAGSWARTQRLSVGLELLAAVVFAYPAIAGRSPLAGALAGESRRQTKPGSSNDAPRG